MDFQTFALESPYVSVSFSQKVFEVSDTHHCTPCKKAIHMVCMTRFDLMLSGCTFQLAPLMESSAWVSSQPQTVWRRPLCSQWLSTSLGQGRCCTLVKAVFALCSGHLSLIPVRKLPFLGRGDFISLSTVLQWTQETIHDPFSMAMPCLSIRIVFTPQVIFKVCESGLRNLNPLSPWAKLFYSLPLLFRFP